MPHYLDIKVLPKAKNAGVEKVSENSYRVRVTEAPEKGAANKAVVKSLAGYLNIAPSRIKIVRGEKSRVKRIKIMQEQK